LFCSPRTPARGYWPAIDPLASRTRAWTEALVEQEHIKLAFAVLETLAWAERVRSDPWFDQLAAARSFEAAILRTIEFGVNLRITFTDEQREQLVIAEQLERFLAQPLFVDRRRPDLLGTHVARNDALVGCRDILAGRPPAGGFDYPARPGC
jgi:F0F1-type ATP synthase beta subunit